MVRMRLIGCCGLVALLGCADDSGSGTNTSFGGSSTGMTGADGSGTGTPTSGISGTMTGGGSGSSGGADTSSGGADTTGDGSSDSTSGGVACDDPSADVPDINGLDENGDGIDGVLCYAVFVNLTIGSDLNDGIAQDEPVASIGRGIEIAQTFNPPRQVLVSAGNYIGTVNLDSGVSIYGGYDPDTWDRDVLNNITEITGDTDRSLIGQNLNAAVEVDGFTINGPDFPGAGAESTYAVWIRDTPEGFLTIDYCLVNGGTAGGGSDGGNGGTGNDGGNGTNGSGGTQGTGGSSVCNAIGGVGGNGSSCPSTAGGPGQAGGDPTPVGTGGPAGASHCGDSCDDEGQNGTAGGLGSHGLNGGGGLAAGSNIGSFDGSAAWVSPALASPAEDGDNGGGGGGGGAGGYDVDPQVECVIFFAGTGIGGGGGGGGAGGCGGDAGTDGTNGGGSFGIVVYNSSVDITNTDVTLGTGGAGGDGGDGGDGGLWGDPGTGASGIDNGGEPGNGASGRRGGGGGGGGGGAGGCGGAAVGIATAAGGQVGLVNVSYFGGSGGSGGSGGQGGIRADALNTQAPAGDVGCAGLLADQQDF